jgi:leucine-rich repeat kinase 1
VLAHSLAGQQRPRAGNMDRMESGDDDVASSVFSMCTSGDAKSLKALYLREPYVKSLIQQTYKNEPSSKKIAEKTLHASALRGHYETTQFLLEKGANPNVSTALGTPIYAAVKSGSLEMVKLLIKYDANYRITGGFSPVYIACIEGKLVILKYLVNIGADLFSFDNPPLVFTACSAGKLDVLNYLMEEMDYDIHRTIHGEDALRTDGRDTLLYTACQRGKTDVAQYLMSQGAYITQTITNTFPQIIKALLRDKFRAVGKPDPIQLYQARLKEMGLAEIPWGVLADYTPCLTRLELRSNYLTSLPDKIFQLPALKNLDISHNRLPEVCQEDVLWECRSLTDFDASHNQITYVPSGLFQMPQLTNVQLSYNLLNHLPGDPDDPSAQTSTGLPADIKWVCEKLKRLDLSHNRLHSLPDTFTDLRRLNVLMLSHNSLKELPPSCSWGCINLVQLDCTMNQLTDLPIGCANNWMHSLERLHLAHNRFSQISRNITELTHLTVLDLSHNHISSLPPTSWWSVSRLMKLQLNHNRLEVLSHKNDQEKERTAADNDRRSTAFRVFDALRGRPQHQAASPEPTSSEAADTQPRELPAELWSSSLQSLYLHSNRLKWLPGYLGKLGALTRLDISSNPELKTLPLSLGRLHNCWELTLHGVTLTNVPHHLLPGVRGGSAKRLLAYLRAQLRHCEPYNRMKLMVVGLQGRGKTTLLSVLRNPTAPLPGNVSTVGVEVVEWSLSPPAHVLRGIRKNQPLQRHQMDIVFSTWDLAGQEVYYATHQCFLSRNTLYLVVWSMEEGEKGIDYLRPWLLNIQARAPHSPVLIVGTHLDKLHFNRAQDLKQKYKEMIKSLYGKAGFPNLSAIMFVASTTQEGIKELQERIHHAAISAIDHDTRDPIIGMQVPASYINLQRLIAEEVRSCQEKGIPPVLSQKEFAALADRMPDSDISDPEELSLAAQFLHDNGVLLHYNDHLRGLNNLYFIDPVWLADLLAEVVTVPQRQNFVHNGILKESNVAFIFHDSRRFPSKYFPQYLQLLERFEIALSLGNNQRLIPSMLPMERPAINFTDPPTPEPQPVDAEVVKVTQRSTIRATLTGSKPPDDNLRVMSDPVNCIRRRYKMAYTPSGFWSRLISRLIINLRRSGLMEEQATAAQSSSGPPIIYWRRGIVVIHSGGRFIVESIQTTGHPAVMGTQDMEASAKYVGEGVDLNIGLQGVDITVWSFNGDFSAMGYVVDHLDSLIDEWFPGLNDLDVEGEWLVQRQVLWKVPGELLQSRAGHKSRSRREQWSLFPDGEQEELVMFQVDACAAEALIGDTIVCRDCNVRVPLRHLVPDLLLTDLPADLQVDQSQLEYNPRDPATRLGRGGAGAVYRGKYRRQIVAVKEFLTAEQAEHTGETDMAQRSLVTEEDVITSGEALFMFRDLRQEVTVLAQLDHPYIVALLGVSIHPMCMVIELAPMGSLFGILDKQVEQFRAAQEDRASALLRMPGGVLGHEISMRIALQVSPLPLVNVSHLLVVHMTFILEMRSSRMDVTIGAQILNYSRIAYKQDKTNFHSQ